MSRARHPGRAFSAYTAYLYGPTSMNYADLATLKDKASTDAKLQRARPIEIMGDTYPWLPPSGDDFRWFKQRFETDLLTYLSRVEEQFASDTDVDLGALRPLLCGLLYLGLRHFGDLDYETIEELVGLDNMMDLFVQVQTALDTPDVDPKMAQEIEDRFGEGN
jgi:hypothetical protein